MFPLSRIQNVGYGRVGRFIISIQSGIRLCRGWVSILVTLNPCLGHPDSQSMATRDFNERLMYLCLFSSEKLQELYLSNRGFNLSSLVPHFIELQNLLLRGKPTLDLMPLSLQFYHSSPQMPKSQLLFLYLSSNLLPGPGLDSQPPTTLNIDVSLGEK